MAALPLPARSAGTEGYDVRLPGSRRRQRIAELHAAADRAETERKLSEERLRQMQIQVSRPLRAKGARNQFADAIRRTLHPNGG